MDELNVFLYHHHQRLSDQWFVDRINSGIRPKELAMDPIDEWLAKEDSESYKPYKKMCPHCTTICKVSGTQEYPTVEAKRFLGKGLSADDLVWMAQCIVGDQN